jgi:hypothetical protein
VLGGSGEEGSGLQEYIPYIIVFFIIFFFFSVVFGGTLMDLWAGRVKKFKDIENLAHLRKYREIQHSCRLSKGPWNKTLWQMSLDPQVNSNSPNGMVRRGRIKGRHIAPSCVYFWFRPRTFSRSYVLKFPVEMLMSSIDDVNVIVEGTGFQNVNLDYVIPIPSSKNKVWTEEMIRTWSIHEYKYIMEEHSDYTLRDFEEHLKLKAGSDPSSLRMIQQGIGELSVASDNEYRGDIE